MPDTDFENQPARAVPVDGDFLGDFEAAGEQDERCGGESKGANHRRSLAHGAGRASSVELDPSVRGEIDRACRNAPIERSSGLLGRL